MYTIREAAARAGVPVSTLRAWERRYGIVSPARSAAAYRLYAPDEIETLRRMRRLVESGWAPSVAAAALRRADADALVASADDRVAPPASDGAAVPASGTASGEAAEPLIARFLAAAIELDQAGVAAALDEMFARGTFERVAGDLVLPALRRLGDAWSSGSLSVAGEHAASHAVLRRLAAAFEAAGGAPASPAVIVGLPPGGRHELGTLAFATTARRAGLSIAYVGADLPLDDWRSATATAEAAVIGVPTEADADVAIRLARQLRRAHPDVVVAVGGPAAPSLPGVVGLPEDLGEAASALAAALSGRARRP